MGEKSKTDYSRMLIRMEAEKSGLPSFYSNFSKQVVFEDGSFWNNPDYESWFQTYAGKEIDVDELQNYYPQEYRIELD